MSHADLTKVIESLNVEQLRARLHALAEEQAALKVFLKAALAKERYSGPRPAGRKLEATRA